MTRRIWVVLAAVWFTFVGFTAHAQWYGHADTGKSVYLLKEDLRGMPYKLVLRHCAPAEDTMSRLLMVEYDPANSRVVYRCVQP